MIAAFAALFLGLHFGQGFWTVFWMLLAAGLSQPIITVTKRY